MTTEILDIQPVDCWKTNGVWSPASQRCEKLKSVVHCRNCEIFMQAGRDLLERPMPENYRQEWTKVMATQKEQEKLGTISVIIFRIAKELFALPTRILAEIIAIQPMHSIPHRKNPILIGLVNVHGEIQLCVSLQVLLEVAAQPVSSYDKSQQRMIVIDHQDEQWVFPVDEIRGIYRMHPSTLKNAPVTVSKSNAAFTKGLFNWKEEYVAFLDSELVLYRLNRSMQ